MECVQLPACAPDLSFVRVMAANHVTARRGGGGGGGGGLGIIIITS